MDAYRVIRFLTPHLWFSYRSTEWTESIEHSQPWETNACTGRQQHAHLVQNLNIQYHVHNGLPMNPIPSLMKLAHHPCILFCNICFHIILTFTPRSSHVLPSCFPPKIQYTFPISLSLSLSGMMHAPPHLHHSLCFYHPNIWLGVQIMKVLLVKFSTSSSYSHPLRFK